MDIFRFGCTKIKFKLGNTRICPSKLQESINFASMKISLFVVGKTVDKHLNSLIEEYTQRIGHYTPFDITIFPDIKSSKSMPPSVIKETEGALLLQNMRPGDCIILLDERGKEYRSVEFSSFLSHQFNLSHRRLVFIIGGAYGFSQEVYDKSQFMLSLSRMTFSHQMVRLIFIEQLYRALTILAGEPYHHEG